MLSKMAEEGLGNNQVEALAWKVTAQREAKKGNRELCKLKKGFYQNAGQRDNTYVRQEMETRRRQARQDWLEISEQLEQK